VYKIFLLLLYKEITEIPSTCPMIM